MKKIILFSTRWTMYLTELPLLFVLYFAIKYNSEVDLLVKLYPLIIALIGGAVFIFVYLFRLVEISYDMIKATGFYSSREKALITEGKTLVITMKKRRKLKIELFGCDEAPPMLDWALDEDYTNIEVNLFRDRAIGGSAQVRKILKYFDVSAEDIRCALDGEKHAAVYECFELSSEKKEDIREIKIKFTQTM